MIGRTKRLIQPLGAILPDLQQTIGEMVALLATHPVKTLADGCRNRRRERLAGPLGELFG